MNWPEFPRISNVLRQTYINGFLDASGPIIGRSDASLNGNLLVSGITTLVGDISANGNLIIGGNSNIYKNLTIGGNILSPSITTPTITGTLTIDQNNGIVSPGQILLSPSAGGVVNMTSDVSANGNVNIGGNLNIVGKLIAPSVTSPTINGSLTVDQNRGIVSTGQILLSPTNGGVVHITSDLIVDGSINIIGNFIQTDTNVYLTDQFDISNSGTGPALIVSQNGIGADYNIAEFKANGNDVMYLLNDGTVSIGQVNPSYTLDVSGTVRGTGQFTGAAFIATSDYRIKENPISLYDENIANIMTVDKLNPLTYFNKETRKQDIGFIAHELQDAIPFLVDGQKDGEELQTINYIGLIGILVKEIQDLKRRVHDLETK